MKYYWTCYLPSYPKVILYMLQNSEYRVGDFLHWYYRTRDFRKVMKRRQLIWTAKVKLLGLVELLIILAVLTVAWLSVSLSIWLSILILLLMPIILVYAIVIPLWAGRALIQRPKEKRMIAKATAKLDKHPAKKIAIVGSYGKTTTREILKTVLVEEFKVAATPGNMNTPIGTSRFVDTLDGDEDVLLFELGESTIGDVRELCEIIQPDLGIITGINEAHLESFGSVENTISTIFELKDFIDDSHIYKNSDSRLVRDNTIKDDPKSYSKKGVAGWCVDRVDVSLEGTKFTLSKGKKSIKATSKLVGEHLVGVLSLAAAVADDFGLTTKEIESGLKNTQPFEHRMQPYKLHGAWIIDDTYNGNREGVEAAIRLLDQLDAKRKVYVTPGLVEQGNRKQEVHENIGKLLAGVADVVVLMQNSTTQFIQRGLESAGFKGELQIIDNPVKFYTHLEHFVAEGDIIMLQNDWPDFYE
tara:strand:+ start:4094 stop:5506 length:1413 start_codon:yes stop_codon:yes gene_type:complete